MALLLNGCASFPPQEGLKEAAEGHVVAAEASTEIVRKMNEAVSAPLVAAGLVFLLFNPREADKLLGSSRVVVDDMSKKDEDLIAYVERYDEYWAWATNATDEFRMQCSRAIIERYENHPEFEWEWRNKYGDSRERVVRSWTNEFADAENQEEDSEAAERMRMRRQAERLRGHF